MQKRIRLHHILIILCLLSIALLLCIYRSAGKSNSTAAMTSIRIVGSYSVDGQPPQELTSETIIPNDALHTVVLTGSFSADVPEGWVLALRLENVRMTMKINGVEAYRYGSRESTPDFSKTPGNAWDFYLSPGITQTDSVVIELQNVYAGTVTNVFEEFINSLCYGHGFELYQTLLREKLPSMLFGFIVFIAGVIAFAACVLAKFLKTPGMNRGMALACVTVSGGIWILIDGGYPYASLLFQNHLLFNAIDILQVFTISVVLILFTYSCLESKPARKTALVVVDISLLLLTLAVSMQIAGLYDLYEIQNWAIAAGFCIALISILLLAYEAFILRNRQTLWILLSWLPLFLSAFAEALNYYVRFMPVRKSVQYGFALSVILQFIQLVRTIHIRSQRSAKLEYELLQSRIAVMLSQIQPHFLFNTLNDIRFLYRESPAQAEEALVCFTRYLRSNMDSLTQTNLIPFGQELSHVQNYINIEKIRFGDRLKVDFAIGCTQFFIPVLTVQPLVENAIRHGVTKKREGGTVTIRTFEDAFGFVIEVCDDGVGFDPALPGCDGQTHTGILNVRTRLENMCGGSLEITSRAGEGTTSIVRIPKEHHHENTGD